MVAVVGFPQASKKGELGERGIQKLPNYPSPRHRTDNLSLSHPRALSLARSLSPISGGACHGLSSSLPSFRWDRQGSHSARGDMKRWCRLGTLTGDTAMAMEGGVTTSTRVGKPWMAGSLWDRRGSSWPRRIIRKATVEALETRRQPEGKEKREERWEPARRAKNKTKSGYGWASGGVAAAVGAAASPLRGGPSWKSSRSTSAIKAGLGRSWSSICSRGGRKKTATSIGHPYRWRRLLGRRFSRHTPFLVWRPIPPIRRTWPGGPSGPRRRQHRHRHRRTPTTRANLRRGSQVLRLEDRAALHRRACG